MGLSVLRIMGGGGGGAQLDSCCIYLAFIHCVFQMTVQIARLREGTFTLVAFAHLFSTLSFQMSEGRHVGIGCIYLAFLKYIALCHFWETKSKIGCIRVFCPQYGEPVRFQNIDFPEKFVTRSALSKISCFKLNNPCKQWTILHDELKFAWSSHWLEQPNFQRHCIWETFTIVHYFVTSQLIRFNATGATIEASFPAIQNCTGCICLTFSRVHFFNDSSNCPPERMHSRIGCIYLTFLHCVF